MDAASGLPIVNSTLNFAALQVQYHDALLKDVIPFWEKHSPDKEHGGYFTCLDRDGSVFDTDKFVWLQARQVWMFSKFYSELGKKTEWLDMARLGVEFLRRHGRDADGNWYFSLTRDGKPIVQPYNIFSDCFAAMAFSEYARAAHDDQASEIALTTYRNILRRRENPKGKYSKAVPGTRSLRAYGLPMIQLNLALELEWLLPSGEFAASLDQCISDITGTFLDRKRGLIFEQVAPDGSHVDSFEGRVLIPGHGIEGMWFLMDVARQRNDRRLIDLAVDTMLRTIRYGWDEEFGGIYYFLDADGRPPQQLEWDQKLWWVHAETLIALSMGYLLTRNRECLDWLGKIHEYTWAHFPDPAYGEWYGYLNRRGEVLLPLKGGKWKGFFHVPRALYRCSLLFGELAAADNATTQRPVG